MSLVRLSDKAVVRRDDSGRSPAFFCMTKPLALDGATVAALAAEARTSGRDVRLCLHEGPDARFHDMIIAQHKGGYYRPHRHADKGETWHMLAGEMGVFSFAEDGTVLDARRLSPYSETGGGQFLYRVGDAMFHTLLPLSALVVYHESKPGPFTGPGDSIFAPWAPDGSEPEAASTFLSRLMSLL